MIAGRIGQDASQGTPQPLRRTLDTRPTVTVERGQRCHVLLIKPLHVPAYGSVAGGRQGLSGSTHGITMPR